MRHRHRWSPPQRPQKKSGFTFVELLVAMLMMTGVGAVLVNSFSIQMRFRGDTEITAETHQGLVAALDSLVRDVRLAGACLPTQPLFVPIAGTNSGTTDSITVRTGAISTNTTCIVASLTASTAAGATQLPLDDVTGFKVDGWGYIVGSVPGELFHVTAVSGTSGPGTVTTDTSLAQTYPTGGGVYALEERAYAIDTTTYGQPVLTRSLNRQAAQPIAGGIESLNIRYRLNQNCPSCTIVDLPPDNPTWVQVSEVLLTATAVSRTNLSGGARLRESATVTVQPRNLVALRPS
jgi:type II secretory pathway pseudopilin PulG